MRIAFSIDEAYRSKNGKFASNPKTILTSKNKPDEEELPNDEDKLIDKARKIDIYVRLQIDPYNFSSAQNKFRVG